MSQGHGRADRLGERVKVYRGVLPRRPLQGLVPALMAFVVLCTMISRDASDPSLLIMCVCDVVVLAVCAGLIVRHTRARIDLHEGGFRLSRPGRRTLEYGWPQIASVATERVEVRVNFSHSHDFLRTVITPREGARIRVNALDFFASEPGAGLRRVYFGGAARGSAESFLRAAAQQVGRAVAAEQLARLRSGGEVRLGPLGFTGDGMTIDPFTRPVAWSRIRLIESGPAVGVRLRVSDLPQYVGAAALAPRHTRAGYSTEGEFLDAFTLRLRPGTDYVALGVLLAEAPALRD
ncbi:hypothetical protein K7472_09040 [Streptomyces sp. PTM05]|uniref:DUF58 domain-containing protein n=1 Tax=Streptantibioticus parmotrematis TaxID=2873249 RepID=A0ABS7QPX9_9ACTN|nr:hypothetical protein [Streptantibioticus parmotrematis]MBY8884988.1 hypothetical protein [Streptantibioticus parmotrematis]